MRQQLLEPTGIGLSIIIEEGHDVTSGCPHARVAGARQPLATFVCKDLDVIRKRKTGPAESSCSLWSITTTHCSGRRRGSTQGVRARPVREYCQRRSVYAADDNRNACLQCSDVILLRTIRLSSGDLSVSVTAATDLANH